MTSTDLRGVDLNLLPLLDALLSEESVTRAATRVGLSTPAMSHALGRLRQQLDDPLLVRSGRKMVLSARGAALREPLREAMASLQRLVRPAVAPPIEELARSFSINASDYVLLVLGGALDDLGTREAPHVALRFLPNAPTDPELLRDGKTDLVVGVYGELPPELRTQKLFDERLVCVAREGHPRLASSRLTLKRYVELPHIQVAPRGQPGGLVDDVLARAGLERRVMRAVPYFLSALHLAAESDYVLTAPERIVRATAARFGLRMFNPPIELEPYAVRQLWHPRHDRDAGHRWLRGAVAKAAELTRPKRRAAR